MTSMALMTLDSAKTEVQRTERIASAVLFSSGLRSYIVVMFGITAPRIVCSNCYMRACYCGRLVYRRRHRRSPNHLPRHVAPMSAGAGLVEGAAVPRH